MRLLRSLFQSCAKVSLLLAVCWVHPLSAQVAPPLGQAGTFAVLGGSAVTNTGPTSVVGDLGISPGSSITGFPPGSVSGGVIHANDAVALGAQNDSAVAYVNLAGQPSDVNLTGQDLGGLTLTSGVYTFNSSAQLTGTLTLDAQGDPAAVFVFQIGSTLTTASASQVVVINGGANCNVFWQVGSSATLGTATAFVGNILALTSITLNTGATTSGRLLARNGAVTLDSNNVEVCVSCTLITVLPATLPAGSLGAPYTQALSASGGTAPYTFSISSGALPPGLALSATGQISGIPTSTGSFTFTVQASDANGCLGEQTYTIVINPFVCGTIDVFPATLPTPVLGAPYNQSVGASGGLAPYTFAISAGTIPPGLTFVATGTASASLIGTPTASGTYTFTVQASDANGCLGERTYTIVISPFVCDAITVFPATLPIPVSGVPYNQSVGASGGLAPYTFAISAGAIPTGLTFVATGTASASLIGTPTQPGTYTFTVTATDALGCTGSQTYVLQLLGGSVPVAAPVLSPGSLILLGLLLCAWSVLTLRQRRI